MTIIGEEELEGLAHPLPHLSRQTVKILLEAADVALPENCPKTALDFVEIVP